MASFGEVVVHIIYSIIVGIVNIIGIVIKDVFILFSIVFANVSNLTTMHLVVIAVIFAIVIFGLFKFMRGQAKTIIIAILILLLLLFFGLALI